MSVVVIDTVTIVVIDTVTNVVIDIVIVVIDDIVIVVIDIVVTGLDEQLSPHLRRKYGGGGHRVSLSPSQGQVPSW